MEYMFAQGFLGTKAPFFMDAVTIIVALLPLIIYIAILFAKKRMFRLHGVLQTVIYLISVIVVGYFEYGVRAGGGFAEFAPQSGVAKSYLTITLVIHIVIATLTFIAWSLVTYKALLSYKRGTLPGSSSYKHKVWAKWLFIGITLTAITGIIIYLLLFLL